MSILDDVGLLCLAIETSENQEIVGRTRLQKIVYFCQYQGWYMRDYKMHYYGPFSYNLTNTIQSAESIGLIREDDSTPHVFGLTEKGLSMTREFEDKICDPEKTKNILELVRYLSSWTKEELEIAATIDYVEKGGSYTDAKLLEKVGIIKDNFTSEQISKAFDKWKNLKADSMIPAIQA